MKANQEIAEAYLALSRMVDQGVYVHRDAVEELKVLLPYVRAKVEQDIEANDPGGFERMGAIIRQYTSVRPIV